jgi:hypothetical protein|tara:strand:+ start:3184 stop:3357 length:174 start_codon:yes stop_codon:yes gene_type:complete
MKNKTELIDTYYNWFMDECSNPYDELEWLINCALESKEKDNVIEALETTHKHFNDEV